MIINIELLYNQWGLFKPGYIIYLAGLLMTVYKETIALQSHGDTPTFINITDEVKSAIKKSKIKTVYVLSYPQHTSFFTQK